MGTVLRAIAAYWFLLFTIRIIGRRHDQTTPFELILIFMIGGMSIQAIVSDDRSLTNAFIAIATVGIMHVLVAWLKQKSQVFGRVVDGTPIVILEKGEWLRDRMHRLRIQDQDVMASARAQGITKLEQIRYAIVERTGNISIIKQPE